MTDYEEQNRKSWNVATVAHNSHKGDQAAFFRDGGSTLFPEELRLLGDVRGRNVLHLQCNSGQDSLSIAALGARVTGVDISDEAITFATELAAQSGIFVTFHRDEVINWLHTVSAQGQRFEIVFVSYGALCWLPDINAWARGVASVLSSGGRLILVEFHPFAMSFDESWTLKYDYFCPDPIVSLDGVGDYVAASGEGLAGAGHPEGVQDFANPHPSVEFSWGIGQVVTALIEADLRISRLEELPYSNGWKGFDGMEQRDGRRMYRRAGQPAIPLMYALEAAKA
ncbi:class I SAM-dependent methyltransferase [Hyphomicrobium sp. 2TAF46]|uniref:class I SAM-dependent methyltransferase n=1 Tax=Hyphomicrobium sp. 2TAF46 TaxID=3233019 RepID=UPI003F913999